MMFMNHLLVLCLRLFDWIRTPASWWAIALVFVLSVLLWTGFTSTRTSRAKNSDGQPLGASAIPKIRGRLPGNIDILWQLIYNGSHEYCGETLRKWAEEYGPTFDMNILFAHQVNFCIDHTLNSYIGLDHNRYI
jgi:hypothetical protein